MFQEDYWERKSLAKRRDPAHPVVRDYVVPKLDWVRPHLTLGPGARILDVGAGNGFFSAYLAGWGKVTAVDLSAQMLGMNPAPQRRAWRPNTWPSPTWPSTWSSATPCCTTWRTWTGSWPR